MRSEKIFGIKAPEIESIVETNCEVDYIWRGTMVFVCVHLPIKSISDYQLSFVIIHAGSPIVSSKVISGRFRS